MIYKHCFKEVMLHDIKFGVNNDMEFKFYNSDTGEDIDSIVCKGISMFKYSSGLLLEEESMPYFVLDVTVEKIDKHELISILAENKFSFSQQGENPIAKKKDSFYVFKIQGGGIDIIVICQEFQRTTA